VILKSVEDAVLRDSFNCENAKLEFRDIKLTAGDPQTGKPFSVSVNAVSLDGGLGKADLFLDSQLLESKYVWLDPGKSTELLFDGIKVSTPRKHELRIGECSKKVTVH